MQADFRIFKQTLNFSDNLMFEFFETIRTYQ